MKLAAAILALVILVLAILTNIKTTDSKKQPSDGT